MTSRQICIAAGAGCVGAYTAYKAKYDPPHLVWDLDNTLLCSVTPVSAAVALDADKRLDSFDQVDDDFPYGHNCPNTRTYWRPGARAALVFFRHFAVQHVFTAAQGTYTENILNQTNRLLFHTVIHRDLVKQPQGKDLEHIVRSVHETSQKLNEAASKACGVHRCVLFDDRLQNFIPQNGENGVQVRPFELEGKKVSNIKNYFEIARWGIISLLALLVPDVRTVLLCFRSKDHQKFFETLASISVKKDD